MKKILWVLGFLLFAAAFSVTLPCDNQLFAVSGCCMERSSSSGSWSGSGKNFAGCSKYNQVKDGDDLFEPRGFVWWDVQCRS